MVVGLALAIALLTQCSAGALVDALSPAALANQVQVALDCPGRSVSRLEPATTLWAPTDPGETSELKVILSLPSSLETVCSWTVSNAPPDPLFSLEIAAESDSVLSVKLHGERVGLGSLLFITNRLKASRLDVISVSSDVANRAFAHRGGGDYWPEDVLVSVLAGQRLGAAGSEMDVRLTKDSIPVLLHDESVDRTTNGTGRLEQYTFEQLQQFDAGAKFSLVFQGTRIPSLEQVLSATAGTNYRLLLDIKRDGQTIMSHAAEARLIIALVRKYGAEGRVILSSTSREFLTAARAASPTIDLGLFDWGYRPEYMAFSKQIRATSIMHHPDSLLTPRMGPIIDSLRAAGIEVYASTANRPTQLDSLVTLRNIKLIVTDLPPRMLLDPLTARSR